MTADRVDVADRAARAGARAAMDRFRSSLEVDTKTTAMDLVTNADREAQAAVVETINEVRPEEQIVGEEDDGPVSLPQSGPCWIVDPIDGTNNYVNGIRVFATAVAAIVDGECVAAAIECPALEDRYRLEGQAALRNGHELAVSAVDEPAESTVCPTLWWGFDERAQYGSVLEALVDDFGDIRRFGSAQIELATVAAGGLEAAVTDVPAYPWDTVAGVELVRAAGGTVTDLDGDPWHPEARGLVASNGAIHAALLDAIAP